MMLKLFILFLCCVNIVKSDVTVEYTEDGVLRKDGSCDITFVNFGTEENLSSLTLSKSVNKVTGNFNLTIKNLINGNMGLNYETTIEQTDLLDLIKITQNKQPITDFTVPYMGKGSGKINIVINNLSTCDGLIIKQTFKDETVTVANRLYYVNVVPTDINHAFESKLFGPSYSYPFERIHWKMNEGLDDLRKTCGIYILYTKYVSSNGVHWQYYLSVDSINTKKCTTLEFFQVIKRNYIDFHYTLDLLGENYVGYVLKREGHIEAHMDGVIMNYNYMVEIYQNSCNEMFEAKTFCTIRSDEALLFSDFAHELITDCLKDTVDPKEKVEWAIESNKAIGRLNNQVITISKSDKGSLPKKTDNLIKYNDFKIADATYIARFIIDLSCKDGSFMNESCQCQACTDHCGQCIDANNCIKCKNESVSSINEGFCVPNDGYFEDPVEKIIEPCKKECSSCNNLKGCTACKDPKAIISDGVCICPGSYMTKDGTCFVCDASCSTCNEEGCLTCADPTKIPDENGKCN